ncbi:MAG: tetratricopeptide repeat protein [Anaerolineales bacterium]
MKPFGELLSHYINRAGISDAELARRLGVSRQTVFRWREGLTDRPRQRDDVVDIASKLRLTSDERDELLLAAGFSPEEPLSGARSESPRALPEKTQHGILSSLNARQRWAIGLVGVSLILIVSIAVWMDRADGLLSGSATGSTLEPAAPGETLILISPFVSYGSEQTGFNVAGRLQESLAEELATSALERNRVEVVQDPVVQESAARELGERYGAHLIVWGEYDSGRVIAFVTPLGENDLVTTQERRWLLSYSGELLTTINSNMPDEVRWLALYILGQTHLHAGRLDDAQTSLERALAIPPEEPTALGGVYFQLGLLESRRAAPDLNKVVAYYSETLQLQPGHISALNNRAVAYLERDTVGDVKRAETDLRSAVDLAPSGPVYLTNLALTLVRIGPDHLEEALTVFEQAEEQAPESASIQNSLCWFYSIGGMAQQAMSHCDHAVGLDPSGYSNDSRGLALALLGRFDEAVEEFRFFLDRLEVEDEAAYDRFSPSRLEWIATLQAGRNPFDEAALQALLNE